MDQPADANSGGVDAEGAKRRRVGDEALAAVVPESTNFVVDHAPDDRARCRGCRAKIEAADLRIVRQGCALSVGHMGVQ
eukprot:SAG11_NODE_1178_length_5598_cov_4.168394_4_plen_79_part_00